MDTNETERLIAAAIDRVKAAIKKHTDESPSEGWQYRWTDIVEEAAVVDLPDEDCDSSCALNLNIWTAINKWWDEHSKEEYASVRAEARKTKFILPGDGIKSAERNGRPIKVYCEDSGGSLFILRNSMGIQGIAQANTWEDACEVCEDELFDEAESWDEIVSNCGFRVNRNPDHPTLLSGDITDESGDKLDESTVVDSGIFQESYGFRPNGANSTDVHRHGIYAKDLNGESLVPLTPELAKELGITITVNNPW